MHTNRKYRTRNKHFKRPDPGTVYAGQDIPRIHERPLTMQYETYPIRTITQPSRKQIIENIYWATKKPSRIDDIYRTIFAAERHNRLSQTYDSMNNIEKFTDNVETEYKNRLRNYLLDNALKEKYIGGSIMGGSAVDFPISTKINKNKLDEYAKVSLSNGDIERLLHGHTNIFTYPQLSKINHIDEILDPYDSCVIIYLTKKNYGHWVCLTRHGDRISFFDSYGMNNLPDEQLKNIPEHFRRESGQNTPHLTRLLYGSGYPIEYNNYKFQKRLHDTNTCGRHVINRIRHKHLNIDQYYNMMKKEANALGLDYDQLVTMLTSS
jgi:hypothetical protein